MDARKTRRRWLATVPALLMAASAQAQTGTAPWTPDQPLKIVVGFAAGGPTDVAARVIADSLTRSLGQTVIVENRPGANATIAAEQVARAKPDGLTLLMAATNHTINAVLYPNLRFDSDTGFAPIAEVAVAPTVLVVNPKFPAQDYASFLAMLKAKPGGYTYASAGSGGTPHLSAEMFKMLTGTSIVHVPYKGAAPAVADLMGGQVDMSFATLGSVLPQIRAGNLRALAVAAPVRPRLLPETPTFEESGLKNFRLDSWYGLMAPAGTPRPILDRLHADIRKAVDATEFRDRMGKAGLEAVTDSDPDSFSRKIKDEIAMFAKVVKTNKLTID